jgi:hypothetical protein
MDVLCFGCDTELLECVEYLHIEIEVGDETSSRGKVGVTE